MQFEGVDTERKMNIALISGRERVAPLTVEILLRVLEMGFRSHLMYFNFFSFYLKSLAANLQRSYSCC